MRPRPLLPTVLLAAVIGVPRPAGAGVYVVDRGDDSAAAAACNPGVPSDCSLRGAILNANANPGQDGIVVGFQSPLGRLMLLTIPRSGADSPQEGDLDITDDLIFDGGLGQGAVVFGVDPFNDRIFDVALGVEVTFDDLVIAGGRAPSTECGGGLRSAGADVRLVRSEVRDSSAPSGGGICTSGGASDVLRLFDSSVIGNAATGQGGGIYLSAGSLDLENSTISGNTAGTFGGAVMVGQVLTGSVTVEYSTLVDNTTVQPNADFYLHTNYTGTVTFLASIVGGDCRDPSEHIFTFGANLESPGDTCAFHPVADQVGISDLGLEPLATAPGVVTRSHAPRWYSPAVDNPRAVPGTCPLGDQRAQARPHDGDGDGVAVCDSGSVETLEPLFADGFESGDASAWSAVVP